ncbi:uncharacterized protein BYT42DRAFT_642111 [Radiomyces spectabilis]|uniref:uncharacterized protein n=1 Tax=Radiomyces spectabilis TaxID=64574 RepID=UPI00222108F5|nr:uncharacterized protein BYT42DRAFT_642111 [Radiomyces spectabilis]KAI8391686.1 hypothetical protein BYT42DRAFT_642111 [Radiomyces spectabilis]
MNPSSRRSNAIYIGNIPFDLTEEELTDVFKEVGPIANFRLMYDRDANRHKGYAFCEYYDPETAASAVRNLNEYELGGRALRVSYASADMPMQRPQSQSRRPHGPTKQAASTPPHSAVHSTPPLQAQHAPVAHMPPNTTIPPVISPAQQPTAEPVKPVSAEEISSFLNSMTADDLFALISNMKQMSVDKPQYTREFLMTNPSVAYALFQAMIMMNIVDANIITTIVNQTAQSAPAAAAAAAPPAPAPMATTATPTPPMATATPPMAPTPPMVNQVADEQQRAILMQVLQLTDDQINSLPPQQRDQIRQLKAQMMQSQ